MSDALSTISQVSATFGVSTRTLRYYEQIGLLRSLRRDDYAYRVYDEDALRRLRQILVLRKLRIPLGTIARILQDAGAATAIDAFLDKIHELDTEMEALALIRDILQGLVGRLRESARLPADRRLLDRVLALDAVDSLAISKINLKEDTKMEDLNKANEQLSKLTDVRIVYLPPCTVASAHYIGESPEEHSGQMMTVFIDSVKLWDTKPDARLFGFNHPNPTEPGKAYGYESWITIPDNLDVPAPLTKKQFPGGLYAAHMIQMGNFHEWEWLAKWVGESPQYTYNSVDDGGECMNGLLEEVIGYLYYARHERPDGAPLQLDLLFPIRPR